VEHQELIKRRRRAAKQGGEALPGAQAEKKKKGT
jgi:hypothetical protein